MAKAHKLKSGSWNCVVYSHTETILQPDGTKKEKRIYKSFTCDIPGPQGKRACEAMAAEWAEKKENLIEDKKVTFAEAVDLYIQNRSSVLSPSTIRGYRAIQRNNLGDLLEMNISDITQEMIQCVVNQSSLSHSPKTVRNVHGLISAVMKTYRPGFPIDTQLPKRIRPDLNIPEDKDVKKILDYVQTCDPEMEIPILLAAFGPMRRSEICALESTDISGNVIHVTKAMVSSDDNKLIVKSPKSYAGDRYIELPGFVIEKMSGINGRIVSLTPSAISNRFETIIKNSGVEHFRFHDLRHYCASIQHSLGIPDAYIMQRGGWGSDTVLKTVYRHALKEKEKNMTAKANRHFEKLCKTKCKTK